MSRFVTKRRLLLTLLFGLLAGFMYSAGSYLDHYNLLLGTKGFLFLWIKDSVIAFIIGYASFCVIDVLRERTAFKSETSVTGKNRLRNGLLCGIILFLCWVPALLSLLPGIFSYDAWDEWAQVQSGMLTAHHPVWHVLLLGGLVEGLYQLTGNYNIGITVYSVLQMIVMAVTLTIVADYLKRKRAPKWFLICTLLFYGISPVFQLFSGCATKDIYFTCFETLFLLFTIEFVTNTEQLLSHRKSMCLWALTALGTVLARNNGIYIVLLTLLPLGIVFRKELKLHKRHLILALAIILVPYFLYTGPLYKALHVVPGGVEEMLSVPMQQMALVHDFNKEQMEQEDKETLYRYLDEEALDYHSMTCVDSIKKEFNRETFREDKVSFFRLWARLGIKYPLTYVEAFLVNTVDFWYPNAVVDGYSPADSTNYFDYQVLKPGEARVIFPGLHSYFQFFASDIRAAHNPILRLLLSPGWYLLCWIFAAFYFWMERSYRKLTALLPIGIHMLTVLMGPMALVRYVLILYFAFPVLVWLVCCAQQK